MTHMKHLFKEILLHQKNNKKESYDKKTYPKLVLNKLKVRENYMSMYTHWASSSKSLLKKFQFACGRCSPMCTRV
jgi:hypothetical protein